MRSLSKPLQASVLIDENVELDLRELAVISGSHAGEKCHIEVILNLLNRFGLEPNNLKCGYHPPLSGGFSDGRYAKLYNNCSGKHAGMLVLCQKNNWNKETYLNISHPAQNLIYQQHQKLCRIDNLAQSTDGCGAPVWGLPLVNIAKGYLNLFLCPKYEPIKRAFLDFPYLIGGIHRLDTEIIQSDREKNLIAKVGAGGLAVVLNLKSRELLLLKVSDAENHARALIIQEALKQLNWSHFDNVDTDIITLDGKKIGEYNFNFKL